LRVNFVAVEKFQGIEHGIGLLGAVGLCDTAQRFLRGLLGVAALPVSHERRKMRIFRGAIGEMLGETFRGDGIHRVADVQGAARPGDFEPFHELFARTLIGDFHRLKNILAQPFGQVVEVLEAPFSRSSAF
jgi:hypothetical protein